MSKSQPKKCCSNCKYSTPSFNLLYCSHHDTKVHAVDTCTYWVQQVSKICAYCSKSWAKCDCHDDDSWLDQQLHLGTGKKKP